METQRTNLCSKDEIKVIQDLENRKDVLEVMLKWEILQPTVNSMKRNTEKIQTLFAQRRSVKPKECGKSNLRRSNGLYETFKDAWNKSSPWTMSNTLMQERAKSVAEDLGVPVLMPPMTGSTDSSSGST